MSEHPAASGEPFYALHLRSSALQGTVELLGAGEDVTLSRGRFVRANGVDGVRVTGWDGVASEAALTFQEPDEAVVQRLGLDEEPLPISGYVVWWIIGLFALQLAAIAIWLALVWRAASTGRTPAPCAA